MTQVGESVAVTQIQLADDPEHHWVEVEYTYSSGLPVEGQFVAQDAEGTSWTGRLDDKGMAKLNGLPSGNVDFELLPGDQEPYIEDLRKSIKRILDDIIADEKREAAEIDSKYDEYHGIAYPAAVAKGFWNGAVGLVSFAWETVKTAAEVAAYLSPVERVNNLLHAAYDSYKDGELTEADWRESLFENYKDEEFKDLARLLGFDIRDLDAAKIKEIKLLITEAYEITAFILDDADTLDILEQFAKDYASAQSDYEWAEFAGGGVFELVLAALLLVFTAGIGNAVQVGSKLRHAKHLKKLGFMFRRLGKLLKRKKLNKTTSVGSDSKKTVKTEHPEKPPLSVAKPKRLPEQDVPCFKKNAKGTPEEFDRQLAGQQKGLNNMTAKEYVQGRNAYDGSRGSTASLREDYKNQLIKKYRKDPTNYPDPVAAATQKMKTLHALHNPDMIAGGADKITDFGDASVNQSIGVQWKKRVSTLDEAAEKAIARGDGDLKMNVNMKRCK